MCGDTIADTFNSRNPRRAQGLTARTRVIPPPPRSSRLRVSLKSGPAPACGRAALFAEKWKRRARAPQAQQRNEAQYRACEMRAGIAASPHCAERRICRCSQSGQKPEGPDPLSILAHQLRRRFPSNNSLRREALTDLRRTTRRITLLSTDPASSRTEAPDQNRPMFRGPSWVGHSCVPLRRPHRNASGRVALEEDQLFRRLIPTDSASIPKNFSNACRRRSDLWSPAAPSCRCRLSGGPGPPSRSPMHHALVARVGEAKYSVTRLWITGIS